MRYVILVLLPVLSIFLQSTLFHSCSINGSIPDMVLIFVVFYALFNEAPRGTIYGFLCGLLEDLYMGNFIGMNALSKGIVGYLVTRFEVSVFRENALVGVGMVVVSTFLNNLLMLLLAMVSFKVFNWNSSIFIGMCYQVLYNTFLAIPLYFWYYNSNKSGWLKKTGDLL